VGLTSKEKDQVFQRAKTYCWERQHLFKLWIDGHVHVIPHPKVWESVMRHAHKELGHFGVHWTYNILQGQYWWKGMELEVQQFVSQQMVCDQVCASFNAPIPHL
jgi:hypothetical protein